MKTYMQMMRERMDSFMEWKKKYDALSEDGKQEFVGVQERTQASLERGESNSPWAQKIAPIDPDQAVQKVQNEARVQSGESKKLPDKWSDVTQEDKDTAVMDAVKNFSRTAQGNKGEQKLFEWKTAWVGGGKSWNPAGGSVSNEQAREYYSEGQ